MTEYKYKFILKLIDNETNLIHESIHYETYDKEKTRFELDEICEKLFIISKSKTLVAIEISMVVSYDIYVSTIKNPNLKIDALETKYKKVGY